MYWKQRSGGIGKGDDIFNQLRPGVYESSIEWGMLETWKALQRRDVNQWLGVDNVGMHTKPDHMLACLASPTTRQICFCSCFYMVRGKATGRGNIVQVAPT